MTHKTSVKQACSGSGFMLSGWLKKTVRAWTKEALNLLFAPSSNNATYPAVASIGDAKVLVIMLTHLGDCVIYQPFLAGLLSVRREGETVHLLVKSGIEDLFSSCSRLTLWPFHCPWVGTGKWVDNARDWIRLIIDLRKSCFDIVIVTHPHFLTSLTARLIGAKYIVGFAEAGDQLRGVLRRLEALLQFVGVAERLAQTAEIKRERRGGEAGREQQEKSARAHWYSPFFCSRRYVSTAAGVNARHWASSQLKSSRAWVRLRRAA